MQLRLLLAVTNGVDVLGSVPGTKLPFPQESLSKAGKRSRAFSLGSRRGRAGGRKPQMVDGGELLSVLIAKIFMLKGRINLCIFQPEGRRPFRLCTAMATRMDSRIGRLNTSGKPRR